MATSNGSRVSQKCAPELFNIHLMSFVLTKFVPVFCAFEKSWHSQNGTNANWHGSVAAASCMYHKSIRCFALTRAVGVKRRRRKKTPDFLCGACALFNFSVTKIYNVESTVLQKKKIDVSEEWIVNNTHGSAQHADYRHLRWRWPTIRTHATQTQNDRTHTIGRFVVNGKRWKFITETEINFNKWKIYDFRLVQFHQFVFCVLFFRRFVIYLAVYAFASREQLLLFALCGCLSLPLSLTQTVIRGNVFFGN